VKKNWKPDARTVPPRGLGYKRARANLAGSPRGSVRRTGSHGPGANGVILYRGRPLCCAKASWLPVWQTIGRRPVFPPEVAVHLRQIACEHGPAKVGRSLSHWDWRKMARQLEGLVVIRSRRRTVRRGLATHKGSSHGGTTCGFSQKGLRCRVHRTGEGGICHGYTRGNCGRRRWWLCLDEKDELGRPTRLSGPLAGTGRATVPGGAMSTGARGV